MIRMRRREGNTKNYPAHNTNTHCRAADIIGSDIIVPIQLPSQLVYRHILTITDEAITYAISIPIRYRSELTHITHSEDDGENHAHVILQFLSVNEISQTFTTSYQPQENSRAERFSRSLMDAARCAIRQSKLPRTFWDCDVIYIT